MGSRPYFLCLSVAPPIARPATVRPPKPTGHGREPPLRIKKAKPRVSGFTVDDHGQPGTRGTRPRRAP